MGGYYGSFDTAIAIEALTELSLRIKSLDIDINIEFDGNEKIYKINEKNTLTIQKQKLSTNTRDINIVASGVGLGIVHLIWSYNLKGTTSTDSSMRLAVSYNCFVS